MSNETQQEYPRKFSEQFTSNNSEMEEVLLWVNQLHEHEPSISQETWNCCRLAIEEGFNNAILHANFNAQSNTPINIEITLLTEKLKIQIWNELYKLKKPVQFAKDIFIESPTRASNDFRKLQTFEIPYNP